MTGELLDQAIVDPEICAYEIGYLASNAGFPYGEITTSLLNRATGVHNAQQNDIFPWISDLGKPDLEAKREALDAISSYRLETTEDYLEFIQGSRDACLARIRKESI